MSSQRVIYFTRDESHPQNQSKQKLERKSTRLTNSPKILSEPFNNNQQVSSVRLSAPSPVQSSDQASSVEVKYLSYLARVIDSAPEGSDSQQIQSHYHNSEYWHVIFECAIYVKKCNQRTNIDDNLIWSQISQYLIPDRIHPEAKNEIGRQLLTNGYFLSAYAIATGRRRKSPFMFKYLMQHFQNQMQIETNYEEFNYIITNYIEKLKVSQFLNIPIQPTPGQQSQHQSQNQSINNQYCNNDRDIDNQQPIKRAFLTIPIDQFSDQDSKTINLDDLQSQNLFID